MRAHERCLTGVAPRYLTELAVPVASTARRRLRSVPSADLVVPSTRRYLFVNVVPISNLHCQFALPSELLDNRRVKFQNNFMLCTDIHVPHYYGIKL